MGKLDGQFSVSHGFSLRIRLGTKSDLFELSAIALKNDMFHARRSPTETALPPNKVIYNKQINQSCLLKLPCRDEQPHVCRSIDSPSRFTAIKNELSRRSARILCFYWQLEEHLISSVRSNQDTTPADLFEGFNQSYGQ